MKDLPTNLADPVGSPDERLSDWVDARMEERERTSFAKEVSENPALAAEVERFEQTIEVLRRMPRPNAPDDFLSAVQSRIRRRSRGRWFGFEDAKTRFPYEAAFNIVLIGILFALYLSASQWTEPERLVRPVFSSGPVADLQRLMPAEAKASKPTLESSQGPHVVLTVTVLEGHAQTVLAKIAENPQFEVLGHATPASDSKRLLIRLRYHRTARAP